MKRHRSAKPTGRPPSTDGPTRAPDSDAEESEKKPPARHGGPERHAPTDILRAKVEALRAYGAKDHEICYIIGIKSQTTLYKYYGDVLKVAKAQRHAKWASELENIGLNRRIDPETGRVVEAHVKPRDRAGVLMFLLQCQAGWRRRDRVELANPDGTPLQPAVPGGYAVVALIPDNGRAPAVLQDKRLPVDAKGTPTRH